MTRGDLLNALDGGVGVSALQMWWRMLTGRSLVLRSQPSGARYRIGEIRGGRVEVHRNCPWPDEPVLLAPAEVCRRFVVARDRSEIAEPGGNGVR